MGTENHSILRNHVLLNACKNSISLFHTYSTIFLHFPTPLFSRNTTHLLANQKLNPRSERGARYWHHLQPPHSPGVEHAWNISWSVEETPQKNLVSYTIVFSFKEYQLYLRVARKKRDGRKKPGLKGTTVNQRITENFHRKLGNA